MIRITKGPEPRQLIELRASENRTPQPRLDQVASSGLKQVLREATSRDQGGICCYCQTRIKPQVAGMKIEHFEPQSSPRGADMRLDWQNLHGACLGNEGRSPSSQSCDTHKGSRTCSLDPLHVRDSDFSYTARGRIRHPDQAAVDDILNLNARHLQRGRRQALDALSNRLRRSGYSRAALRRELDACTDATAGMLPPFAGLLAHYLRRKLRQHDG